MEIAVVQNKIYEIRGQRVMLDFDLAEMYQVETKNLNLAVKRNIKRFPPDFMFQITNQELANLRLQFETSSFDKNENEFNDMSSQIVTSSWGGTRYLPYAFTEHGVTMLASVLRSDVAIQVNIVIIRAFIALRQYALGYAEMNKKLEDFMRGTNMQFSEVYQALAELAEKKKLDEKPRIQIGYTSDFYKQRKID